MRGVPKSCEAQTDIRHRAPGQPITCPHDAVPTMPYCPFHLTHRLQASLMVPIRDSDMLIATIDKLAARLVLVEKFDGVVVAPAVLLTENVIARDCDHVANQTESLRAQGLIPNVTYVAMQHVVEAARASLVLAKRNRRAYDMAMDMIDLDSCGQILSNVCHALTGEDGGR